MLVRRTGPNNTKSFDCQVVLELAGPQSPIRIQNSNFSLTFAINWAGLVSVSLAIGPRTCASSVNAIVGSW